MSFSIDDIKLFDPFNPTDPDKFSSAPASGHPKLDRFQPMRETAGSARQDTIGFGERWEERICQLSSNAHDLFKLNPNIKISKNCARRMGRWKSHTPQTADLVISNGNSNEDNEDEEYSKQTFKQSIVGEDGFGADDSQQRKLSNIIEVLDDDGDVIKYGSIGKKGMLGSAGDALGTEVRLIKIITPVPHFTMALYYPTENRVEFWDSGGSWGAVSFDSEGNPYSETLKRRKQTRSEYGECLGSLGEEDFDKDDLAICRTFKKLIPSVNFVAMNTRDLQISDADAYCQTWVLLYTYMRFIYPIMTTIECVDFFKSLDETKLLLLIESWAEYLIYFDFEKERRKDPQFEIKYSTYISSLVGGGKKKVNIPSNNVYKNIYNAKNKKYYSINSKEGKALLKKYLYSIYK